MTQAKDLELNGVAVRVIDSGGNGRAVLFCHGNSASSALFAPWFDSPLARRYRFIALDFPGHGKSPPSVRPASDYSLPTFADVIRRVLDGLVPDRYVVVGHSLGGHAAALALPTLPRLAGLMLISAPPVNLSLMQQAFLPDPTDGAMFTAELAPAQIKGFADALLAPGRVPPSVRETLESAIRTTDPSFRPSLLASIMAGRVGDERLNVEAAATPTCMVFGELDPFLRVEYFRQLTLKAPFRGGMHGYASSGHAPHLDSPQAFLALLGQFLDEGARW